MVVGGEVIEVTRADPYFTGLSLAFNNPQVIHRGRTQMLESLEYLHSFG
jgi:hypothetical protein